MRRVQPCPAERGSVSEQGRIVPADNKRRARLNLIRHLLDSIPYKKVDIELPKIPKARSGGPRMVPRV